MIPGSRGGPARPLRAAAVRALAAGAALAAVCLLAAAPALAAAPSPRAGTGSGDWTRAWSWEAGSGALPKGCVPYSGRSSSGIRWSPSLVSVTGSHLRLTTAPGTNGGRAVSSGIGCTGRAQRYGRLEVRARVPAGAGLVGRVALWPSTASRGSDWSGLTVPAADLTPAYATNGCGDEAYGATVAGRFAGSFHTYVLTWTPTGFAVTADGRRLYADDESFDGERWLGISLTATGRPAAGAQLLVDRVVAYRWTGAAGPAAAAAARAAAPLAATPSPGVAASGSSPGVAAPPEDGDGAARVATSGSGDIATGAPAGGGTANGTAGTTGTAPMTDTMSVTGAPPAADPTTSAAAAGALVSVLDGSRLGTPWVVGGAIAAAGVLVGVVRAALASRRRSRAAG